MGSFHLGLSSYLLIFVTSLVLVAESSSELKLNSNLLQDSIINTINENPKAGWTAGVNSKFSDFTVGQFKTILGARRTPQSEKSKIPLVTHPKPLNLPKEFDARTAWPKCTTIGKILDQGHCGSCWAFGAVEALSDRFCTHFNMNIPLSVNDLLSCCGDACGDGCDGGKPISAWNYLVKHGVVTEACDPYFDTEGCNHPGCKPQYPTPKCAGKCTDAKQLWKKSKHYAKNVYRVKKNVNDIMAEVFKNGPVEVAFDVYEDGYFKIKRGTNECGIEEDVVAGLPKASKTVTEMSDSDSGHAASI